MITKRKIIYLVALVGIIYFLICYHSENKKIEIVNEIFQDINFTPENICHVKAKVDFDEEVFKEFSFFDKLSSYSQFSIQYLINSNFDIQENRIKSSKIVSDCSAEMEEIQTGSKTSILRTKEITFVSMPILSTDNKTAVIQIENNCGMLCGSGSIYIFKKINGKWTVIKEIERWIS